MRKVWRFENPEDAERAINELLGRDGSKPLLVREMPRGMHGWIVGDGAIQLRFDIQTWATEIVHMGQGERIDTDIDPLLVFARHGGVPRSDTGRI